MENHAKINMTSSSFPNQTRLKRFLCAFMISSLETWFLSHLTRIFLAISMSIGNTGDIATVR
jgi:hypothetical protein